MACPRCDGPLERYAVADGEGRVAVACERCGYVGVPADHRPDRAPSESWDEALHRFRRRHARSPDGTPDDGTVALTVGGTTYRVGRDVSERYEARTEKQQDVIRELLQEPDPGDPERTRAEIAEAAGVHRSYAGEVARRYGDIAVAIAESEVIDPDAGG